MILLERIREGDWAAVERMRETLEKLTIDTGGISAGLRSGVATVTFSASTVSNTVVVPHGLGATPRRVLLGSPDALVNPGCFARDDTDLTINAACNTPISTTINIDWLVIG